PRLCVAFHSRSDVAAFGIGNCEDVCLTCQLQGLFQDREARRTETLIERDLWFQGSDSGGFGCGFNNGFGKGCQTSRVVVETPGIQLVAVWVDAQAQWTVMVHGLCETTSKWL